MEQQLVRQPAGPSGLPARSWNRFVRDVAGAKQLVMSAPIAVWLVALVAVSVLIEVAFVRRLSAPWIFPDELIYSELGRSFAATGHFAVRGASSPGYGVVYPVLIAPAYAASRNLPHAYAAAKAINAALMSLAAVPTYFLARRVLGRGRAFLAAALAVAVPSTVYAGSIMTESAFYPVFLLCALAFVLALEQPTRARQLCTLATLVLAYLTRAQAIVLVPAYVTAIVLLAALDLRGDREQARWRSLQRRLAAFRLTWLLLGGGGVLVIAGQLVRGRSLTGLVGAYRVVVGHTSLTALPRWLLYHFADLDLYVGIVPFAAFFVLVPLALRRSERSREVRAFAVTALSLVVWMTVLVAAFASSKVEAQWNVARIHERNLFYVVPLLVTLMLVWLDRGMPRPRLLAGAVALVAGLLPRFLPFHELARSTRRLEVLPALPWWNTLIGRSAVPTAVMVAGLLLAAVFLLLPRRLAVVAPVIVFLNFYIVGIAAQAQVERASRDALAAGIGNQRDWIDRAVGSRANVLLISAPQHRAGEARTALFKRWRVVWQNEFFNRSIRKVYYLDRRLPYQLPETRLIRTAGGSLVDPAGSQVVARYVLAPSSLGVAGSVVARDRHAGIVLYSTSGFLRLGRASR